MGDMATIVRRFWLWAVMLAVLWSLVACSRGTDVPYVRLETNVRAPVAGEHRAVGKLPLRVAVAAVLSPETTFDTYRPLLDVLSQALDRPVELLQRPTYAEINELIRTGQADMAFVCGGAFVEGEREGYMELLAAPRVNGQTVYHALVIVPADSPIQSWQDLQGSRFAFTDPLSNSGRLYMTYLLWQETGRTPDRFFKEIIFTYSHENSIRAVAAEIVDGATVDSLVYNYMVAREPGLKSQIRVIHTSPPFGIPPVVVHPELDPGLKTQLRDALLTMNQTGAGRKALRALHVDGFTTADEALYEPIRTMAATMRGWKQATAH